MAPSSILNEKYHSEMTLNIVSMSWMMSSQNTKRICIWRLCSTKCFNDVLCAAETLWEHWTEHPRGKSMWGTWGEMMSMMSVWKYTLFHCDAQWLILLPVHLDHKKKKLRLMNTFHKHTRIWNTVTQRGTCTVYFLFNGYLHIYMSSLYMTAHRAALIIG